MNEKQTHLDWGFGLKWVLACAVGTVVWGIAAYGSMWWAGEAVTQISSDMLGTMVAGFLFGALFALGGHWGRVCCYAVEEFRPSAGLGTACLSQP